MNKNRFLVSTQSYRHEYDTGVEIPTQYGYLVETNFRDFERYLSIPTSTESPQNERIKTGLRGISTWEEIIYVASWNVIYRIDPKSLEIIDSFSHALLSDVHGIHVDAQGIWVCSSLIDSLLHFNWNHELINVCQFSTTQLYPRKHRQAADLTKDYRYRGKLRRGFASFHANHVTAYDDDHILVTGRGEGKGNGRVILVNRKNMRFKVWIKSLKGPHDGLWLNENNFAVTETDNESIAIFNTTSIFGRRLVNRLKLPPSEARFWTRGLASAANGDLVIGRSVWDGDDRNASIVRLSQQGELIDEYELTLPDYPECRIFQIHSSPSF